MWVIIFQTKSSKVIKLKIYILILFFYHLNFTNRLINLNMAPMSITCWKIFPFLKYFFWLFFLFCTYSVSHIYLFSYSFLPLHWFLFFSFYSTFFCFPPLCPKKIPPKQIKFWNNITVKLTTSIKRADEVKISKK